MSSLALYNTMTREIAPFIPLEPGKASIYLCGATVQGSPHIGHIRSGLNFDILRRWLEKSGLEVTFIRNVTDIDDKILQKAAFEKMAWWALAAKYEREFSSAYAALNVALPTYEPRATGHITQMVELMALLIDKGLAYAPGNGDVYMEVSKLDSYLRLSHQRIEDLQSTEDGVDTYKRDPHDFALWKGAKPGEPAWPTPWGAGRPGWHLECSAMIHTYLGESFDIHGGGLDLIFPHHENEIAQSHGLGWPFANIWMHNAWVTAAGEKMSKSLGNSLQVNVLLEKVRGIELRWYLGSAHYRSMMEFSQVALEDAVTTFGRIENFLIRAVEILGQQPIPTLSSEFVDAMNDDLAVPLVLAQISENLRLGNIAATNQDRAQLAISANEIRGALQILGCDPFDPVFAKQGIDLSPALDGAIKIALTQRDAARLRKDFSASDLIRDGLAEIGIAIEDTPQGPRWSISPKKER